MQFKGVKLDNKDLLGKSDPFFLLKASTLPGMSVGPTSTQGHGTFNSNPFKQKKNKDNKKVQKKDKKLKKSAQGGGWVVVYKSETIMNNLNPTWRPFTIDVNTLCHGNLEQPFIVEVWDEDQSSAHDIIGSNRTTLRELMTMKELRLDNAARIGFTSTAGKIEVLKCGPKTDRKSVV